jgi:dTDP-4-amino-4,6-dideoxygalactose transaminase
MCLAGILDGSAALRLPLPEANFTHAFYRFYAFVRPEALAGGWSRDRIMAEVTEAGYPIFSGSCSEIYLEDTFVSRGIGPAQRLPAARELGETSLCFLVDPTWTTDRIAELGEVTRRVCERATRQVRSA